ncbi:MAG: Abortive infection protein [Planctomycetaceae bacterium]|nr:Abortive infection protein [Planctomycetaceae bacterium]
MPPVESNPSEFLNRPSSPFLPRLARLTLKELRETLRDRRTIVTLLLMPILLYPLLTLAFQRFVLSTATNLRVEYIIGLESESAEPILTTCLANGAAALNRKNGTLKSDRKDSKQTVPQLSYQVVSNLEHEVRDYSIDVGLRLKHGSKPQLREGQDIAIDLEVVYLPGNKLGERALKYVESLLQEANTAMLGYRLQRLGVSQRPEPLLYSELPLRDPEEVQNQMLAAIIPVVLILMTITGAVYPAIDLTAGERERGTLEMLVAAPVPRLALLFAKYVAVLTVAFLTAAINLTSMTVTLLVSGMGVMLFGEQGLSFVTVLEVFSLLILFAAFFSAVLLALTSFARSFKEAQAYLIPLMLVSLGPGLAGLLPGVKLAGPLMVAPLLNVVLLARDLLMGQGDLMSAALVVGSTTLYAAAALAFAARIFGTHAILYESQTAWADLFRRPPLPQSTPQLASAMLCLACLFPLCFVLKGVLSSVAGQQIELQLTLTSLATFVAFIGLPLWAASAGHVPFRLAFAWRWPPLLAIPGAILCGVSLWPFAHELILFLDNWNIVNIDISKFELAKQLIERCRQAPLVLVLLSFAILPAVCEEFCFRGYLYRALQPKLDGWRNVFVTGLIFGLFHLVAVDTLAIERLAPTTFLGCILGWIRWRTNSLLPGILLHVSHNGLLALLFYYEHQLSTQGWATVPEKHLPATWLLSAGAIVIVGLGLIALSSPKADE